MKNKGVELKATDETGSLTRDAVGFLSGSDEQKRSVVLSLDNVTTIMAKLTDLCIKAKVM